MDFYVQGIAMSKGLLFPRDCYVQLIAMSLISIIKICTQSIAINVIENVVQDFYINNDFPIGLRFRFIL